MNSVRLSGHLGSDPDLQEQDGILVARLALATSSTLHDLDGQRHTRVDWHQLVLFDPLAQCVRLLCKGDRIKVRGELRSYVVEQNGAPQLRVEVLVRHIRMQMPELRLTPPQPAADETAPSGYPGGNTVGDLTTLLLL